MPVNLFRTAIRSFHIQTFLPYRSFEKSARALDQKRLGKQRVETLQILNTLAGNSIGWKNHPAITMWRGHEQTLIDYGIAICQEWRRRGYKDTCLEKIAAYRTVFPRHRTLPDWLGNRALHRSYQSLLLRKLPDHYRQFFTVADNLEFTWPA